MPTLVGILGFPVAHSRSPQMQNAAFRARGLDWRYVKLPISAELFAPLVGGLEDSGYRGANVTIPHKLSALAVATQATESAATVGAANTLGFQAGEIVADNTDVGGLLDAMHPHHAQDKRALVLGAGGAARAAVFALASAGASEVSVWNRTPERAHALAHELGASACRRPGRCDLLVNATSVGLDRRLGVAEAVSQLGLGDLDVPPVVVDLVYRDGETPVCAWARRGGAAVVDGLSVLVCQGARSFERWTQLPAPTEVMRAAVTDPWP